MKSTVDATVVSVTYVSTATSCGTRKTETCSHSRESAAAKEALRFASPEHLRPLSPRLGGLQERVRTRTIFGALECSWSADETATLEM